MVNLSNYPSRISQKTREIIASKKVKIFKRFLHQQKKRKIQLLKDKGVACYYWLFNKVEFQLLKERKALGHLLHNILTFVGVISAIFLLTYKISYQNGFENIFLAAGGFMGTALAITYSLGVIAVQKASETLGTSLKFIYREDAKIHAICTLIGIYCFSSFAFFVLNMHKIQFFSYLLALQLLFLGRSIDLIREFSRYTSILLDTKSAVGRLYEKTIKEIQAIQKRIKYVSSVEMWRTKSINRKCSNIDFQKAFYSNPNLVNPIKEKINELGEIAYRATRRHETHIVKYALEGLTFIGIYYVNVRKENFIIYPDSLLTVETDARNVLMPIYEHLKAIHQAALLEKNEIISVLIVKAFENIAVNNLQIADSVNLPLLGLPIEYLKGVIRESQRANMDDVGLRGGEALGRIAAKIPPNYSATYVPAATDAMNRIAREFLIKGSVCLSDMTVKELLTVLHIKVAQKIFDIEYFLGTIFKSLEELIILAEPLRSNALISPCPIYDSSALSGLGALPQRLQFDLKNKSKKEQKEIYEFYCEFANELEAHFKRIFNLLPDSSGTHTIILLKFTLEQIISEYFKIFKNISEHGKPQYIEEISLNIKNLLWFYGGLLEKFKQTGAAHNSEKIFNHLSWIALSCYDINYKDMALGCIEVMAQMIKKWQNFKFNSEQEKTRTTQRFLIEMWYLIALAKSLKDTPFVEKIDTIIKDVPSLNRQLFEEEINDYDYSAPKSKRTLQSLLEKNKIQKIIF